MPMRLFLCDDNAHYRALARLVLERDGHAIVGEAGDGVEVVALASRCDPAVVLLDINMPRATGLEALPALRETLPPETRILILTTGQAPHERRLALAAGADGFIVKPERIFSLGERLRDALDELDAEPG